MAKYRVTIRSDAQLEFGAIPFPHRRQLNQLLFKLMENPRPANASLIDGDSYRIVAHGWVVLYVVDDDKLIVGVMGFRKSSEAEA